MKMLSNALSYGVQLVQHNAAGITSCCEWAKILATVIGLFFP